MQNEKNIFFQDLKRKTPRRTGEAEDFAVSTLLAGESMRGVVGCPRGYTPI